MRKYAFVFPGQASQYVGMGKELAGRYPTAGAVFEESGEVLGGDFTRLLREGPAEELNLTENTQPGVLAVSIAAWRVLRDKIQGIEPAYLAGHSLGEYSAYVAAGSLSFPDALRTVRARGRFMQEAVPVGVGAMAALIGPSPETVERICTEAAESQTLALANDNAPGQVVIAGHAEAVQRAIERAKAEGCRRAVVLPVSAPFHSALMAPAREKLAPVLAGLSFNDPEWPVVANTDARPVAAASEARRKLVAQVDSRVRWRQTLLFLLEEGVDTIIEVGPGRVLSGLAKRVDRSWRILNVEDERSLQATLAALNE